MKTKIILFLLPLLTACSSQQRKETMLDDGWLFSRDNVTWNEVSLPHDWAINGPFNKDNDLQYVAIEQNGETQQTEKSGRSGALPWTGMGFYKTTITLDETPAHAELLFDGAMSEPAVTINGKAAGYWPYGYNAFRVDATGLLHEGDNVVEVALNNREESSRWYPGAGIYRPVKLITTSATYIDTWDSWVRTAEADSTQAIVTVSTQLKTTTESADKASVKATLYAPDGSVAAVVKTDCNDDLCAETELKIDNPELWSPETPSLYTLVEQAYVKGSLVDETRQRIGIRTVDVSAEHGFRLNGVSRKIKGVCLHHDLGPLGAAVNKAALIRQIRILKEMGCDAIRTAHNMPSTMQMEVCDSMGMMVMAESFDMWIYPKCKNGYARFFNEWSERDITNLILNHRDHPSIIMWSIGNEIPEQWSDEGREIAQRLQDLCHSLDPTRPVTQGMDKAEEALGSGFAQVMDVPGFNYRVHKYDKSIEQLPQGFLLGSETASTVSSRGVYKFPVEVSDHAVYPDGQCSSYDTEYCSWSNLPDDDWQMQDDRSWVIGEFVWTGFDYLGEPTPYDEYWPSRSSYFGICDLAGLPKDRYWLYRSHWRTDVPTLHVLPHWTWPGREGEVTPIYCYTSYDSAELFVNGVSQGRIAKDASSRLDRYRLRWNNVIYQPGEMKVVAYDADGTVADSTIVRTAGEPARIVLSADRDVIASHASDLCFVTVSVCDADGNACPTATNLMSFEVEGSGSLRAVCNGDATSLVTFNSTEMPLFSGQLVVVVEGQDSGTATLVVSADGLPVATLPIKVE